ncbi:MAG: metallopeptidase TldD-related protein [Candidatus Eremiobacteraeota bacterium]|nr:metallopeptidase TldD-related protein [Candidatus Eremiobacteraeota bacterium]
MANDPLSAQSAQRILDRALRDGGLYADVFCERRSSVQMRLQEGAIHEAGLSQNLGAGVRVVVGESAGYAYTEELTEERLLEAAARAAAIARLTAEGSSHSGRLEPLERSRDALYDRARTENAAPAHLAALLERAEIAARAGDARIVGVNAHVVDELQELWIARSDGSFRFDRRPMVTLGVQCIARSGQGRGTGYCADGGRTSIAFFESTTPEQLARESARIAAVNLDARPAPAGEFETLIGAGGGGVLLHEAVGHGLEGDFNRRGVSLYSGRIGERVASDSVTIYDDGDIPEERGSASFDDEGTPCGHTVLVERGILRGYLHDELNARLMGMRSTGNGRRQSFRHLPQPRMCNTYMPPGDAHLDEMIATVDRGIYAKSFAGGQVDIGKGDFVFMIAEGYLIERGRLGAAVKNATIVGNGPDAMTKVTAVGNDARLARRHYTCGKGGQYVPVGVGMPTLKISAMSLGGTEGA